MGAGTPTKLHWRWAWLITHPQLANKTEAIKSASSTAVFLATWLGYKAVASSLCATYTISHDVLVHDMTQGPSVALRCVASTSFAKHENIKYSRFFMTRRRNATQRTARIYPCVHLRCAAHKRQSEGGTMQCTYNNNIAGGKAHVCACALLTDTHVLQARHSSTSIFSWDNERNKNMMICYTT